MDRKIEHKSPLRRKHIPYIVGGVALLALAAWFALGDHRSTVRVKRDSLLTGKAQRGEFSDYVRVTGSVQPLNTVQLTPLEGGIVEERIVEEGASVKRGDIIVRLSNPQLNIQILESEASLAEKENWLRETRVTMEQEKLALRRERLSLEKDEIRSKRKYEQSRALWKDELTSQEEYLQAKEDYEFARRSVELIIERQEQDSIFRALQVNNMESNLRSMQRNMKLVRERVENLNVKSPIDGELGLLDVVLGQSVQSGYKMGQLNDLTDFKVEAMVDEHYIDRVVRGLKATFTRGEERFSLKVSKVFPEVREGRFRCWFTFTGSRPDNIRTGQTYYINLELGSPEQALMIPRGAFFASTAGNWIYTIDGGKATKRSIRIGRQNPQYYEILDGLSEGEAVVISSYESFGNNNETLTITE